MNLGYFNSLALNSSSKVTWREVSTVFLYAAKLTLDVHSSYGHARESGLNQASCISSTRHRVRSPSFSWSFACFQRPAQRNSQLRLPLNFQYIFIYMYFEQRDTRKSICWLSRCVTCFKLSVINLISYISLSSAIISRVGRLFGFLRLVPLASGTSKVSTALSSWDRYRIRLRRSPVYCIRGFRADIAAG